MDLVNLLKSAFIYVASQNLFWGSMGFTTAIAMFVGVMLFDGNMEQTKKGLVSVLSYAGMIFWTTLIRVMPISLESTVHTERVYAGIATVAYITFFWLLGIFIGVNIFRLRHKTKENY